MPNTLVVLQPFAYFACLGSATADPASSADGDSIG
jgi:hypothetical protein